MIIDGQLKKDCGLGYPHTTTMFDIQNSHDRTVISFPVKTAVI